MKYSVIIEGNLQSGRETAVEYEVELTQETLREIIVAKALELAAKDLSNPTLVEVDMKESDSRLNTDEDTEEEPSVDVYETYSAPTSEEGSGYRPYSSMTSNTVEENHNNTEATEETSTAESYTPYATHKSATSLSESNFPKSYHENLINGYTPYNSFRISIPHGSEPQT